jgi:CheY-like chemotaxis protein/predicted Ser/Thr protein kinase
VSDLNADQLLHVATELELAPAADLQAAYREAGGHVAEVQAFGQALVRHELLTSFQLERLLAGNRSGFYYGPAKLLYQVGAGSFARVYRAIHRDTGEIVAVKVLRKRHSADPEKRQAFQREGEMGRLLRHKNIVAIDDVGEQNGASYLRMEFVEGQTLRELTKIRGAIDVPTALELILHMLAGLDYAHRRGVAHRDLKASNVLVSSSGVAKLVDFGLARVDATGDKVLGRGTQPRTIDYAALEKLTGIKDDDFRSDIYFLGTIAYLALSGKPALKETRDRGERADPRRFLSVEPLPHRAPGVPRDVCELVARMMHLDPLERWQTVGEVAQAIERLKARHAGGAVEAAGPRAGGPAAEPAAGVTATGATPDASRGRVMIVESSQTEQEVLREFFKKLGYRVLLTSNPRRALARFSSRPLPAECLVLSARSLGPEAVEVFNEIAADPFMSDLPAILLTDPRQTDLLGNARFDERRRPAALPPRAEEIGPLLESLIGAERAPPL